MLTKFDKLIRTAEGRYATDEELKFLDDYAQTMQLRADTYNRLRALETDIVDRVQTKMQSGYPHLLQGGTLADATSKWRQDTLRVLRFAAMAVLIDDPDRMKESFLYWFQTIMKAFGTGQSCAVTYTLMQETVKQMLPAAQADLLCPILELTRTQLGETSS